MKRLLNLPGINFVIGCSPRSLTRTPRASEAASLTIKSEWFSRSSSDETYPLSIFLLVNRGAGHFAKALKETQSY